jgi:hypothetical protein
LMMSMTNQVVCDDEYVDACPVRVGWICWCLSGAGGWVAGKFSCAPSFMSSSKLIAWANYHHAARTPDLPLPGAPTVRWWDPDSLRGC